VTRRVFNVVEEPRGEVLCRLIRALGQYSSSVMMVLRLGRSLAKDADNAHDASKAASGVQGKHAQTRTLRERVSTSARPRSRLHAG
jgi:hypothetical protein